MANKVCITWSIGGGNVVVVTASSIAIDRSLVGLVPNNQPTNSPVEQHSEGARVSLMAKGQSVVDPGRCGGGSTLDRARGPVADNVSN